MADSRTARQSGMTLISLVTLLVIVGLVAVFFMKITPVWIEYFSIKKAIKSMEQSGDLKGAIPAIRTAFDKRAEVGYITVIGGKDLELSKTGEGYSVGFSYRKEIPIVGNMSVVFDFQGSVGETFRKRATPN
jgi:Domain of unknown function (DUF4845)